jgi:GNAT superfamily N-acetyltransferase
MSKTTPPIRLRPAGEEDIGFIFNSWLKSFKTSGFARNIINTIYYADQHRIIENLLKNQKTVIACNNEDPSQIYGFINAGEAEGIFCLNYVYIKHSFRGLGIAKALLESFKSDFSTASVFTHHTRMAEKLAAKYNMVYHPYLLFNIEE